MNKKNVCALTINCLPESHYRYVIVKCIDGELWYHGSDNNKDKAYDVAYMYCKDNDIETFVIDAEV